MKEVVIRDNTNCTGVSVVRNRTHGTCLPSKFYLINVPLTTTWERWDKLYWALKIGVTRKLAQIECTSGFRLPLYLLLTNKRTFNFLWIFFFSGNTTIYLTVTFLRSCRVSFDFGNKLLIRGTRLVWTRLKKAHSEGKFNVMSLKSKFNEFGAFSSIIQDISCPTLIKLSLTRRKLQVNIVTFDHPMFLHLAQILKQFWRGKKIAQA